MMPGDSDYDVRPEVATQLLKLQGLRLAVTSQSLGLASLNVPSTRKVRLLRSAKLVASYVRLRMVIAASERLLMKVRRESARNDLTPVAIARPSSKGGKVLGGFAGGRDPDATSVRRLHITTTDDRVIGPLKSDVFFEILGRIPTDSEIKALGKIYAETHLQGYIVHLVSCDEFYSNQSAETPRLYVRRLHGLAFGEPAVGRVEAEVAALQNGDISRKELAEMTFALPEAQTWWARRICLRFGDDSKTPELGEIVAASGGSIGGVMETLLERPEILQRAKEGWCGSTPALRQAVASGWDLLVGSLPVANEIDPYLDRLKGDTAEDDAFLGLFVDIAHEHVVLKRLHASLVDRLGVDPATLEKFLGSPTFQSVTDPGDLPRPGSPRLVSGLSDERAVEIVQTLHATIGAPPDIELRWAHRLQEFGDIATLAGEIVFERSGAKTLATLRPRRPPQFSPCPGPFVGRFGAPIDRQVGDPTIVSTYFYWYDCVGAPEFLENPDAVPGMFGESALTHQPVDLENFTYRNVGLHERELKDMAAAGIDVALPVYFGSPLSAPEVARSETEEALNKPSWFSDWALRRVVEARENLVQAGQRAPAIGLFYDTSSSFNNAAGWHLDVRGSMGRRWIFETWRNFFSQVPRRHWACIDGRPVVFVYHPAFMRWPPQDMYDVLSDQFENEFGVRPFVVTAAEQDAVQINDNSALTQSIDLVNNGKSFEALTDLLASDEVLGKAGGTSEGLAHYVYEKLFSDKPTTTEATSFVLAVDTVGRHEAVWRLVNSPDGVAGVMAYMATRWLRLRQPVREAAKSIVVQAAVHAALSAGDLMGGYIELLASAAFYEAAGGSDEYFIDYLDRQTTQVFSSRASRAEDLELLRCAGRRTFVESRMARRGHVQGMMSHWFWWYMGRFFPGGGDSQFYWSGAIDPMFHPTPSIGPGYDQSALRTRSPLRSPRDDGRRYSAVWQNLLAMEPRPWLVHLETWNEFFEGTDLCETVDFGRQYIDLTRYYGDRFHGLAPWSRSEITEPDIHRLSPVVRGHEDDENANTQEDEEMTQSVLEELRALRAEVSRLDAHVRGADQGSLGSVEPVVALSADLFPHSPLARGVVYEPDVYRSYEDEDVALLARFAQDPSPVRGSFVDFLGRVTDCQFLPSIGHLEGRASASLPVPGDGFYADTIEYVGLLKAYETLARPEFVAVELGAGWGPWITAAGVIARHRNVSKVELIGVEASAGKIKLMKKGLLDNGLRPDIEEAETQLGGVHARCVQGAIWTSDGEVRFPKVVAEQEYGGAVSSNGSDIDYRGLQMEYEAVPSFTLETLLGRYPIVDFMHVDIQGGERSVLPAAIEFLRQRVRYLFIGTHSRTIEGEMVELFHGANFELLREKPCRFSFEAWSGSLEGAATADGGQLWHNPLVA